MGGDLEMISMKKAFRVFGNLMFIILFLYMVIAGQMNTGLVKALESSIGVTRQGVVGLSFMLLGLCGLIFELYLYNRKHR